jgi:ribonuclease VapC
MVIDASAIVAIFLREPEREFYLDLILKAKARYISAVTFVETGIVLEGRRGAVARHEVMRFLERSAIEVVAVDVEQAAAALEAWRTYGKGRHPAGLNLGDCFSYALSRSTGEPLLAKGHDFMQTDLELCPQVPSRQ